ncbi:PIN domain-containing protein [Micromonospora sp. WMMD1128]|uniref:PIN domain-containing protein n=1 Tax=Micromonospora sp. WMMD1128 TaxID=3015150 RepID=UPI00248B366D|nr:PIN domain-containing protein [Micromonospora sp. WMMD1128]WBB74487.1 PIN domain-containing protein [Micromonospora sp. WMMD1128]
MIPGAPLVFLDANVLFSRTLRDWISLLALESDCNVFDLRYSEDVLAEWMYRLRRKRPEHSEQAIGGQRRRFVEAFPYGLVTGYSPSDVPCPPDSDDRHVLAAAIHGAVDILVTDDQRAFPPECVRERLSVLTSDDFLNWVADRSVSLVQRVTTRQIDYYRRSLVAPDRDAVELIAYLRKAGAPRFARRLEEQLPEPPVR